MGQPRVVGPVTLVALLGIETNVVASDFTPLWSFVVGVVVLLWLVLIGVGVVLFRYLRQRCVAVDANGSRKDNDVLWILVLAAIPMTFVLLFWFAKRMIS